MKKNNTEHPKNLYPGSRVLRVAACVLLALVLLFNTSLDLLGGVVKVSAATEVDLSGLSWRILNDGKFVTTSSGYNTANQGNKGTYTASAPSGLTGQFTTNGSNSKSAGGTNSTEFLYYLAIPGLDAGTYTVDAVARAIATNWSANSVQNSTTKLFAYAGDSLTAESALNESATFGQATAEHSRSASATLSDGQTLYVGLHMIAEYCPTFNLDSIAVTTTDGSGGTGTGSGSGSGDPEDPEDPEEPGEIVVPSYDVETNKALASSITTPSTPDANGANGSKSYLGKLGGEITGESGDDFNFSFEENSDVTGDGFGWDFSGDADIITEPFSYSGITIPDSYVNSYSSGDKYTPTDGGADLLRMIPGTSGSYVTQIISGLTPGQTYRVGVEAMTLGKGNTVFTAAAPGAEADKEGTYYISSNLGSFASYPSGNGNDTRAGVVTGFHTCYVYAEADANGCLQITLASDAVANSDDNVNKAIYGSNYTIWADKVTLRPYEYPQGESVTVPIKLYDYSFRDLDTARFFEFTWGSNEAQQGVRPGLVAGALDENGRPIFTDEVEYYNLSNNNAHVNPSNAERITAEHLNDDVKMFRENAIDSDITLYKITDADNYSNDAYIGYYVFDSDKQYQASDCADGYGTEGENGYFPMCGVAPDLDAEGIRHNYHFGMEFDAQFLVSANSDETFRFTGDDDFWLFIDGVLILDIGGVHEAITGVVDLGDNTTTVFNSGSTSGNARSMYDVAKANLLAAEGTDYYNNETLVNKKLSEMFVSTGSGYKLAPGYHDLTIYYMERSTRDSNLKLITNLAFADLSYSKSASKLDENGNVDLNGSVVEVGDKIRYTIAIENPSTLPSENITIQDTAPAGVQFLPDTMQCYVVSGGVQSDVTTGIDVTAASLDGAVNVPANSTLYLTFDAQVVTTDNNGEHISEITNFAYVNEGETVSDTLYTNPLKVEKSVVDPRENYSVGETITYKIVVTNLGEQTLENVRVDDSLADSANGRWITSNTVISSLAGGSSAELTFQYTVQESDLAAGKAVNNATATAVVPGTDEEVTAEDTEEVPVVANNPALTVNKTAALTNDLSQAGESVAQDPGKSIFFFIEVENSGDALLENIEVTDDHAVIYSGSTYAAGSVITTISSLQPGESQVVGPLTYVVPADASASADNVNTATASCVHKDKEVVSSDTARYTINAKPSITAVKEVSASGNPGTYGREPVTVEKGQTAYYRFTITNSGNVPVTVRLEDVMNPAQITALDWVAAALSSFTIQPGEDWVIDRLPVTFPVDVTYVNNRATNTLNTYATYVDPVDGQTKDYDPSPITSSVDVILTDPINPDMTIDKKVTAVNGDSSTAAIPVVEPGDTVTFAITVINTGNCPLNVSLEDVFAGQELTGSLSYSASLPMNYDGTFTLAAGGRTTVTVDAVIADDAANASVLTNVATATGTVPSTVTGTHEPITRQDDASVVVKNENIVPAIDIKKEVSKTTAYAGETVTYTLTVKNTGNVALSDVVVSDDKVFDENTVASSRTGWTQVGSTTTGSHTIGDLPVGTPVKLTYQYKIPSSALAGESYLNTAVVAAKAPDGTELTDTDNETVTIGQSAELMVTKTVSNNVPDQGDTIEYTVTVTNIGSTPLTGVALVSDVFTINGVQQTTPAAWLTELAAMDDELAPGESWSTSSGSMPFEVPDDAGQNTVYKNTVTVTSDQTGNRSDDVIATVGNDPHNQVSLSKVALNSPIKPGENAEFVIVVTNNSGVAIDDLVVYDIADVIGVPSAIAYPDGWQVGRLEAGGIWTKTVSVPTEAGMKGDVLNNAYLDTEGTTFDPEDPTTYLRQDDAEVIIPDDPRLAIEKTASADTVMQGSSVVYTIVVSNVGNCDLNNVSVTDSISGGIWNTDAAEADGFNVAITGGSPVISLMEPGDQVLLTYTLDHLAGNAGDTIKNIAYASCDDPATPTVHDDADVELTARPDDPAPSIAVNKEVSTPTAKAGQTVSFWITVTNTGNVPLYNVALEDEFSRLFGTSDTEITNTGWQLDCPETLEAGESWESGLLYYTIPEDTLGDTTFRNVVTVNANEDPDDPSSALDEVTDSAETVVPAQPALSVTKDASRTTVSAGQTVVYTVVVENTGNCKLNGVVVTEALTGGTWSVSGTNTHNVTNLTSNPTIPELGAGEKVILLYTYTVPDGTAEGTDIDNTVTATSTSPSTEPATDEETVRVVEPIAPEITVTKTVTNAYAKPGQTEYFQIIVTNTGNVPLCDVNLTDVFSKVNGSVSTQLSTAGWDLDCFETLPVGGAWISQPMPYTVASGAPAGEKYDNTVTVTSKYVKEDGTKGDVVPKEANAILTVERDPGMSIVKTVNNAHPKAGDSVVYTIVVTNTGNCLLTDVDVTDSISGGRWINATTDAGVTVSMSGSHPVLTVFPMGGVAQFTYTVTVPNTAAAGSTIRNIATAETVTDPATGEKLTVSDDVDVVVDETPITPAPAFTVTKEVITSGEENGKATAEPGETVYFWITVTNTGNVPLCNVTLTDEFVRQMGDALTVIPTSAWALSCPTDLAVGQSWRADRLSYEVPANAKGGEEFVNTVTVDADYINAGGTVTDLEDQEATADFTVERVSDMVIEKSAVPETQVVGGDVYYTISVTNTGNTLLENITVTDEMLDGEWSISALEPGKTYVIPAVTYTIPAGYDVEANPVITNTAVAVGTPKGEETPITRQDTANVTPVEVPLNEDITITKNVAGGTEYYPGDLVSYTILVENNGDVNYTDLTVKDELLGKEWKIASLRAGESTIIPVIESVYTIPMGTAAGKLTNVAELLDKEGTKLDEDDVDVTVLEDSELTVIKSANVTEAKPGDTVRYIIDVTNTGNTDLTGIVIEDKITGGTWTLPASLPAGTTGAAVAENGTVTVEKMEVGGAVLQLVYTVTVPADAKSGDVITNVVVADSNQTEPVQSEADVTVKIPGLEVTKTAAMPNVEAGKPVDFYITVANTGDIALEKISVSDIFAVTYEGEEYEANEAFAVIESLAPGASQRFKVTYTVPADAAVGTELVNTATATAENGVTDQDDDTVKVYEPVVETPDFIVRKLSSVSAAKPGDTVTYTIVVANTGNVTLTNIAVTDALDVVYNGTAVKAGDVITTIPSLEPEKTAEVEVTCVVPAAAQAGTYHTNRATADPENAEPRTAENLVQVLAADRPSYTVTKVGNVSSAKPGETVTYTIVVTNTGNCVIKDLKIYDDLLDKYFTVGNLGVGEVWQTKSGEAAYQIPTSAQDATSVSNNAAGSSGTPGAENKQSGWVLSVTATNKGPMGPDTGEEAERSVAPAIIAAALSVVVILVMVFIIRRKK